MPSKESGKVRVTFQTAEEQVDRFDRALLNEKYENRLPHDASRSDILRIIADAAVVEGSDGRLKFHDSIISAFPDGFAVDDDGKLLLFDFETEGREVEGESDS